MTLYTEERVRANIRNRDGQRVFYLAEGDRLTPSAGEWLRRERIAVLPAEQAPPVQYQIAGGGTVSEKPEHMTHLHGNMLVRKDHPRIVFRGLMDALQADLLLTGHLAAERKQTALVKDLKEILQQLRLIMRADVLEEKLEIPLLCGLSMEDIHKRSHVPQNYYGQPHFMPSFEDDIILLYVNQTRTKARKAELAAYAAFQDVDGNPTRPDILMVLNRISSMLWILEIKLKKERANG